MQAPVPEVLRYAAFTGDPRGGNPAGVVLDAAGLGDAQMLAIAADVGYSETAFITARGPQSDELVVRYFSPLAEVPFCGHATIATAVAWADRHGHGRLTAEDAQRSGRDRDQSGTGRLGRHSDQRRSAGGPRFGGRRRRAARGAALDSGRARSAPPATGRFRRRPSSRARRRDARAPRATRLRLRSAGSAHGGA